MTTLALDPGPTHTQYLVLRDDLVVLDHDFLPNETLRAYLPNLLIEHSWKSHVAIETVQAMGMAVGQEVLDTAVWVGIYSEVCRIRTDALSVQLLKRTEIKLHLCGSARAKDANIRQALIDRFGGKEKAIGRKATPGPLYGIASHAWSALAIAVTSADGRGRR